MGSARIAVLAALLLAAGASFDVASAAWPNALGVNVQVAPSGSHQDGPIAVSDGEGGAFIVWNEASNIRAQHLTAQGLVAPGWPATGILVTGASSAQYVAAAVADGAGGFIAVWDDYRSGTGDIYAQRIGSSGSVLWAADGAVVCAMPGTQHSGRLCADRAGGAVFVWSDLRASGSYATDLFAQRLSSTGSLAWAGGGVPVVELAEDQLFPSIVSDGTVGGSILLWEDYRNPTNSNIYAQRLDANGNVRSGWTPNGTGVCLAAGPQYQPALASDGAFGLIATWSDARPGAEGIYAMRLNPSGAAAAGWAANGIALTPGPFYQDSPMIAADGAGGAIVAWSDSYAPDWDVFAQRINGSGVALWTAGGVALEAAFGDQLGRLLIADGAGGAMIAFTDTRAGQPPVLYAQRVTAAGAISAGWSVDGQHLTDHWLQSPSGCSDGLGGAILVWQRLDPSPSAIFAQRLDPWGYRGVQPDIASVEDVPNDQGGRVKLAWDRSPLDVYPGGSIADYLVFRSVPPNLAQAALARGEARLASVRATGDERRAIHTSMLAGATVYWEHLATVPALHLAGYSYLADTEQDSVAGSNPRTMFMVRAQNSDASRFWESDPDSGYSVDDLPPAGPAPFSGTYAAGGTHLHWGPNSEPDFALYRLYRGADASFVPLIDNRIVEQPDTGYVDPGPAGSWYKLTAVDAHGNESVVRVLGPAGTVDAPGPGGAHRLSLAPPFPNPAAGGTTCRFTLPGGGAVRLAVFDASGRLVRELVDSELDAGSHLARWDGRDGAGGRVRGGLYVVRLNFAGRRLSSKFVMLD